MGVHQAFIAGHNVSLVGWSRLIQQRWISRME
jgi:hypothetical protein